LIILTTHLEEKILDTIKSRLLKIIFRPIPEQAIKKFLTENYNLSQNEIETITFLSAGRIGRALYLLNNFSEIAKISEDIGMFLKTNANIGEKFSFIEKITADSQKLKEFLEEAVFILRKNFLQNLQSGANLKKFLKTKQLIENTNANPRLQLESFVLSIADQ